MKKILTAALALVLVFSAFTGVFATQWDVPVAPPASSTQTIQQILNSIRLSVTGLSVNPSTISSGWGATVTGYQPLTQVYTVVAGSKVNLGLNVVLPKGFSFSEGITLKIVGENMAFANYAPLTNTVGTLAGRLTLSSDNTELSVALNSLAKDHFEYNATTGTYTASMMVMGNATSSDKDATLTLKCVAAGEIWQTVSTDISRFEFANQDEKAVVNHDKTDGSFKFYPDKTDSSDYIIIYADETTGRIRTDMPMKVSCDTLEYNISVNPFTGAYAFSNGTTVVSDTTSTLYKTLLSVQNEVFIMLGLTAANAKYMTEYHIQMILGAGEREVAKEYTYPAQFRTPDVDPPTNPTNPVVDPVEDVVVVEPVDDDVVVVEPGDDDIDVGLPDTGDATSIAGFILAAAGALAIGIKKRK